MKPTIKVVSPCDSCKSPSAFCRKNEFYICSKYKQDFAASWNNMAAILRKEWGLSKSEEVEKNNE